MASILIITEETENMQLWTDALKTSYSLSIAENIASALANFQKPNEIGLTIVDGQLIDHNSNQLPMIVQKLGKTIVIGESWADELQIQAIVDGAWGYSEKCIDSSLIPKVVDRVLKNEIWLSRHLLPRVLHLLTELNGVKTIFHPRILSDKQLSTLTQRELDVTDLVYQGKGNSTIADKLNISERTVKAHLSSIFRKLDVQDRFQLVIYLKNLHLSISEAPRGIGSSSS